MKVSKKIIAGAMSAAMLSTAVVPAAFAKTAKPTTAEAKTAYAYSAVTVDGVKDEAYDKSDAITLTYVPGDGNSQLEAKEGYSAKVYTAYRGTTLYMLTEVCDPDVVVIENPDSLDAAKAGERIKYNLDFTNAQEEGTKTNTIKGFNLNTVVTDKAEFAAYNDGSDASALIKSVDGAVSAAYKKTDDGYIQETAVDMSKVIFNDDTKASDVNDGKIGLDVYVNDKQGEGGGDRALFTWSGSNQSWDDASYNGTIILQQPAVLTGVTLHNGTATIDEEKSTVTVDILKNATKAMTFTTDSEATAALSADKNTITVTSADGSSTHDYAVVYNYIDSYTTAAIGDPVIHNKGTRGTFDLETKTFTEDNNGDVRAYSGADINSAGELNWNVNYKNLDPNRAYLLSAYVSFVFPDETDVADDSMIIGLSPCVYDENNKETGWDGGGSWSEGIYRHFVDGGLYTYGELKELQAEADANGEGYVKLQTVVSADEFKFDSSVLASLGIQARLGGLGNMNALHDQFDKDSAVVYGAPADMQAVFNGFELSVLSDTAELDNVKVGDTAATIDEAAKTVKAELPIGSDAAKAVITAAAKDNGKAEISADRKKITVTSEDKSVVSEYALTITVKKDETKPDDKPSDKASVKINSKNITLTHGKSKTITATAAIANAKITWSTSNAKVAAVVNGKITAKGVGTAKITAKSGNASASITVKVNPKKIKKFAAKKNGRKVTFKITKADKKYSTRIQYRKAGAKKYKTLKTTKAKSFAKKFKKGNYQFRACSYVNGYSSAYSKAVKVKIK